MTTNQTIDGVPRELLRIALGFDLDSNKSQTERLSEIKRAHKQLRALLDAPAYPQVKMVKPHKHTCACVTGDSAVCDCGAVVDGVAVPAAQPQGEPVADLIRIDRSYRNGLMAGFQFGIIGDEKGYAACIQRYNEGIQAAKAEQPAPAVKLHVKASNVKITTNEDGSYTIDNPDEIPGPTAWSVRHASGKYGFVTLIEEEAIKWASVRSDVSIHALGPIYGAECLGVVLPERAKGCGAIVGVGQGPASICGERFYDDDPYLCRACKAHNTCLDVVTSLNTK